jgi:predicted secreted hydrolase
MKLTLKLILLASMALVYTPKLSAAPALQTRDGFALPQPGHVFSFPRDYGSHDDFKIEWWYITGHLFDPAGGRFGFQATFFRSAAESPAAARDGTNDPDFGNDTIYMAHMALLDVGQGKFVHQQRLNRRGWDAGSATNQLDVWNGNWWLRMTDTNRLTMSLHGSVGGQADLRLELTPSKPMVVFGKNSVSQKAVDPSAASYYLTFPRLQAVGQVVSGGITNPVTGQAWMDHEISSSQLGTNQAGWDWCCLQFTNNREIMAYRMRRQDGSQDPYSTLAWVDAARKVTQLPSAEFHMETIRTWHSLKTGADYPVEIRLSTIDPVTNRPFTVRLEPLEDDQELAGAGKLAYWEGACRLRDDQGKEIGSAYLELTGYSGNLEKDLR